MAALGKVPVVVEQVGIEDEKHETDQQFHSHGGQKTKEGAHCRAKSSFQVIVLVHQFPDKGTCKSTNNESEGDRGNQPDQQSNGGSQLATGSGRQ